MPIQRILALDVGKRRIGVALSDPLGHTAQPLLTLYRTTLKSDLKSIARLVRRYDVATVLIGLPLHASGEASPQSTKTEAFAAALRSHLAEHLDSSPTLELLDERHTTAQAHSLLNRTKPRQTAEARTARSKIIDQVAATLILEAFLRRQTPALLPDPNA
ncbi:MAG: Holliday junction resolvase RuvX [Acidobacteriaceae bacterium]